MTKTHAITESKVCQLPCEELSKLRHLTYHGWKQRSSSKLGMQALVFHRKIFNICLRYSTFP
jgi:hypothetical protein